MRPDILMRGAVARPSARQRGTMPPPPLLLLLALPALALGQVAGDYDHYKIVVGGEAK